VTAHETYTRARYLLGFDAALQAHDLLRGKEIVPVLFTEYDEAQARLTLEKYREHKLSFHDALLACVMKRVGVYKVFSFDRDFYILGFEILPGTI
jgi:predicted nucleic acid-binding protein